MDETLTQLEVGMRVRLSEAGLSFQRNSGSYKTWYDERTRGTVKGFSKFPALTVVIQLDGVKTPRKWFPAHWEPVE